MYEQSKRLNQKHEEEIKRNRLMALSAAALASITAIIGTISKGTAYNFGKIKEAMRIYDDLDIDAQDYFSDEVKEKLDRLYREAKKAQEDEDEAERRRIEEEERHRRIYNSRSSFSSSPIHHSTSHSSSHRSFSGRGGRTSGGGASRHF